MNRKRLLFLLIFLVGFGAHAQKGFVRGKIIDTETGEGLIGATVSMQGTSTGTAADWEGNYSLTLDPGTYTLVFQFVTYKTITIQGVEVKEGEVTLVDVDMSPADTELQEVVITGKVLKDSDVGLLTVQKKSASLVDGISSQTFRRAGDSDLSSAIKKVTGVSVQGGRYVYVRGLGDRYTRTTLNSMSIPGLDPERNDVQIDIFPTSILENVVVYKTFTPDLSGDFTGGTVDVQTKSFPEERKTTISFSMGYNPSMHFNKDFLSYEAGKTDWLGFDDGTRDLPFDRNTEIPNVVLKDPVVESLTRSLNPRMAAQPTTSFMNSSFSIDHGNQISTDKSTFGYGIILKYQNNYEYYDNLDFGRYQLDPLDNTSTEMIPIVGRVGALGNNDVLWSGLISGAYKRGKHEFAISLLQIQNGIRGASNLTNFDREETGQEINEQILTYTQRSISNGILSGKHNFDHFRINWSNAYTRARIYDPDFRITKMAVIELSGGDYIYSINGGQGGNVGRFWRDLNETNENFKLDITVPLGESGNNKIKVGGSALLKWREFTTDNYNLNRTNSSDPIPALDPDFLLRDDQVWTPDSGKGTYISGNYEAANNYDAKSSVLGSYAMADLKISKLRAIFGARIEISNMFYTGENNFGTVIYDNEKTLDETDVLPSANLVYSLTENMNLRASYGKTLARPSFKEKSIAQVLDPITGLFYNGNIDLEETHIDNYDLRWENFFGRGEMVSVSVYYKQFDKHIELTRFESEPRQVQPRNIAGSFVYGAEVEFRKNFVNGFSVGANASFTKSEVDITKVYVGNRTEYEARLDQAREGETVDKVRPMAGQAPFLVNTYVNYSDKTGDTNFNLSYNVQGSNLSVVGGQNLQPDVYILPFHSLKFTAYRNLGAEKKSRITFQVDNILNSKKEEVYKNYNAEDRTYSLYEPGRTFKIGYSYTF